MADLARRLILALPLALAACSAAPPVRTKAEIRARPVASFTRPGQHAAIIRWWEEHGEHQSIDGSRLTHPRVLSDSRSEIALIDGYGFHHGLVEIAQRGDNLVEVTTFSAGPAMEHRISRLLAEIKRAP